MISAQLGAVAPETQNNLAQIRPLSSGSSSISHQQSGTYHIYPQPCSCQQLTGPAQLTPISTSPSIRAMHTLHTLLHSPATLTLPSRDCVCSDSAIMSRVSTTLIYPRKNSPFPPKRHFKVFDPRIASHYSGITLALYEDAAKF